MAEEYPIEVQTLYLEFLISDHDLFVRCNSILDQKYFSEEFRDGVRFLQEYVHEYNAVPTPDQVRVKTGLKLRNLGNSGRDHKSWFLDDFEKFCRYKAIEQAIWKSSDKLEAQEYGAVEAIISEAVQIGLPKELGINYWADSPDRLKRIAENKSGISTGWETIDKPLYGGFPRGTLNIWAGGPGTGKSIFLQNLAVNWVEKGFNVVYVSLELSEDLCAMRLDSMLTGLSTRDLFKNMEDVAIKVAMKGKKCGSLQIVQLPSGITVNDLKAYIKEYQIQNKITVDAVLVDYLDLMMPAKAKVSADNLFVKDKHISEELRNFAMEGDYLFATASQLNRCLFLDTTVVRNKDRIKIKDINEGDWIESNEGPVEVKKIYPITKQPVYKIKTRSGRSIECSADHKIMTASGLKSIASGLKEGDKVLSVINTTASQENTDEKHNKDNET